MATREEIRRDFRTCEHDYIPQTKVGIPSLLPFVCKHCGMGSWYPTVEEERRHKEEFMGRLKQSLKGNKGPKLQRIKQHLGIDDGN